MVREINGVILVINSVSDPVKRAREVSLTVAVGDFQVGGTAYIWKGRVTESLSRQTAPKANPCRSPSRCPTPA